MDVEPTGLTWRGTPEAVRRPSRQSQRQISIAATGRVVVNANTVEAGVFATGDERRDIGQGTADGNPDSDAERGHAPAGVCLSLEDELAVRQQLREVPGNSTEMHFVSAG